ncbi:hypothetical protein [Geminisphaera colitermitum]|uniref:hypothetical protein n=1 Tax=Geminisphaera colitermitum TaxID=1148786 RepID=UPI0001964D3A|nr:hypothetical protein [Geminisphaera colitermitum]
MHTTRSLLLTLSLGAFAILPLTATANTVYDLATAKTAATGQNTWAVGSGGSAVGGSFSTGSSSELVFTPATTGVSYFIGKFDKVTLVKPGDTLTLNFTMTGAGISVASGQTFRLGLFDIGSATDGSKLNFGSATGYRVDYASKDSTADGIRIRNAEGGNLFTTTTTGSPLIGTQDSTKFTYDSASLTSVSGTLMLKLLAGNQVQVTSNFANAAGDSVVSSAVTTTNVYTGFNAVSFFATSGASCSLSFSELSVTYTAASSIPEPSTAAAFIGGAAALLLIARRFGKR